MTCKKRLLLVSDRYPNEDGHWVIRKIRTKRKLWGLNVKAGFHVVASGWTAYQHESLTRRQRHKRRLRTTDPLGYLSGRRPWK